MEEPAKSPKPLGGRSYGSIPHLPGSRRGPMDYGLSPDQARMLTEKANDKADRVIVQEKLDGSNVAAVKLGGKVLAITRAGYLAMSSPFAQHHGWARWVEANAAMLGDLLSEGERVCGEWLMVAHGTRYALPHGPFVAFDLRTAKRRAGVDEVMGRCWVQGLPTPRVISDGPPISAGAVLAMLEPSGHGAIDPVEGAVWRCERGDPSKPTILAKFVTAGKVDGCYLSKEPGDVDVLNTWTGGWAP